MPNPVDLAGRVFYQLTVKEPAGYSIRGSRAWKCLCDCGEYKDVSVRDLKSANTKSCGCRYEKTRQGGRKNKKHGYNKTYQWRTYWGMRRRCLDKSHVAYHNYGGRGISIHEPWVSDCGAFCRWLDDNLGPRPEGHTLDRIDNDGNYEPNNLRWADKLTQSRNSRSK